MVYLWSHFDHGYTSWVRVGSTRKLTGNILRQFPSAKSKKKRKIITAIDFWPYLGLQMIPHGPYHLKHSCMLQQILSEY